MSRKEYNIQPARGQALLNFQGRLKPTSMPFYEADLIEEVKQESNILNFDEPKENEDFTNLLLQGDCLSACAYLKSKNIKVDLVYIDPPFASGANYAKKIYLRNGGKEFETNGNCIGEEIMYDDIWQKEDYLNWLYERLLAIRDILSDTGSIYLHLDWHIGHYAKILMDEVFGEENFMNEIIWYYENKFTFSFIKNFNTSTENIFLYAKDKGRHIFHHINIPVKNKRKQNRITWDAVSKKMVTQKDENGKVIYYESEYKIATTLWDIPRLNSQSNERKDNNYATQKPEALLERIIKASSNENMIVADFFSGSGGTATVAHKLGRKFIACDIGINALQTTRDRLVKENASFDILKIRDGLRLFRNPQQTRDKLFSLIDGFRSAETLNLSGFWNGGIVRYDGLYEPVHFVDIDKKLTEEYIDMVSEEISIIEDEEQDVRSITIIYAHKDRELTQELLDKKISERSNIRINIKSLDSLLEEKREYLYTPDNALIEIEHKGDNFEVKIKKYFSPYLKKKIDDFNESKVKKSDKVRLSDNGLELIESVQFDILLKNIWVSDINLEDKAKPKEKIKGKYLLNTNKFKIKIRNIAGDEIIINSDDLVLKK